MKKRRASKLTRILNLDNVMYKIIAVIVITFFVTLPAVADESQNIEVVRAMAAAINDRNLDALDGSGFRSGD